METVDIQLLFDDDPRPTFIVDCKAPTPAICHVNKALLDIPQIARSLNSHNALRDWWDPASRVSSRLQSEFRHGRFRWSKFVACERWLIVSIIEQPLQTEKDGSHLQEPAQLSRIILPLEPCSETIFDLKIQSPDLQEHIKRIQNVDWGATSLGPIDSWSYELNILVTTMMLETRPSALFLGRDHIIIYNLAYGTVSGSRHPRILGKSIIDAW